MALTILGQVVEHEEDLRSLREDLDLMVKRGGEWSLDRSQNGCVLVRAA
jgi:hypothetical protein